jgi:uridine kinase
VENLKDLIEGREIQIPVYNFNTSKRETYCHTVSSRRLIIFEGILALYDKVLIYNFLEGKITIRHDDICRH